MSLQTENIGASKEPPKELVAQLLVKTGVLTDSQISHATRIRDKLGREKSVLSVLKQLGAVDDARIFSILREKHIRVPIGRMLLELGYVDTAQLRVALELQKSSNGDEKLGEILVRKRIIKESQLVDVFASQIGCEVLEPDVSTCPDSLLNKVSAEACLKHRFFPVSQKEEAIVVAFADPLDDEALITAQQAFGDNVEAVAATPSGIKEAANSLGRRQRTKRSGQTRKVDHSTPTGMVDHIIQTAFTEGASDIHIEPLKERVRVRLRVDGILREYLEYDSQQHAAVSTRIKVLSEADVAEKRRHQDGRILFEDPRTGANLDMRASFYITVHGEAVVLRLLNQSSQVPDMKQIGMPPSMLERFKNSALDVPSGVIIITGPTGSGKTTTLYSCVNSLNNESTSIITAEDPVEYLVDGISQCSLNPKLDLTYEETLRHIVRQDPDVIVLGEIRDQFSAESAIQAALTGHKVLTTFHTEDSIGGLLRLLNMDIEAFLISSTVVCVVAQRLIRKVCSACAQPIEPEIRELQLIGWTMQDCENANFQAGKGCEVCHFTGYKGRVAVFEALVLNEAVREAILKRQTSAQIRRISVETSGLVTLLEDGLVKAASGQTTLREVRRHLPRLANPRPLNELKRLTGSLT